MPHSPPGLAKVLVTALRSLPRFLFPRGCPACPLAQAVPAAAGWADQPLPRAPGAGAVTALPGSCDRRTAAGMRDFAILTLLARPGLRAGEGAAVTLEDTGWHHGEMAVRGKGGTPGAVAPAPPTSARPPSPVCATVRDPPAGPCS